jgi:Zn-finger nucleic acid-binding protein
MHSVRVPAQAGYCVVVDQCVACGGVWLDRWELYPIDAEAAREIDDADRDLLLAPLPPRSQPLRCPRCQIELRRFTDPSWPADADVERCQRCAGLWLNRGQLRRVKAKGSHPQGRRLAAAARHPQLWPTVRRLDDAMRHHVSPPEDTDLGPQLLAGGAWVVARLLLRWFLGI